MKEVERLSIGGYAFTVEQDAATLLRDYIASLEKHYLPQADGKEIIARDNERSILRKSAPEKAYFGCHTDVTIPYEELGSITVIRPDGSGIRLLENGRFVLPGTEVLNGPLEGIGLL